MPLHWLCTRAADRLIRRPSHPHGLDATHINAETIAKGRE
jgi:hypothetical protein